MSYGRWKSIFIQTIPIWLYDTVPFRYVVGAQLLADDHEAAGVPAEGDSEDAGKQHLMDHAGLGG